MITKSNKIIASILLLFIISCSSSDTVTVEDFTPTGEVPQLTTFTVTFSRDIAPAELVDQWVDEAYIEFDPKIDGKFKWQDSRTLVFSPDYPLEPIQNYTAKITNRVISDPKLSMDFDTYEFHTPDLDAVKADFFWTRVVNKNYTLSVQANIHFNYPVAPDQLKQFMQVEKAGEPITDFEIVSNEANEVLAVNFGEIQQMEKEQEFVIKIKKGLTSVFGKKPMEDEREFEQDLPPITKLAVTGIASGFDGTNGWIEVNTTQMVDEDMLREYVSVSPISNVQYFMLDNGFRIEGKMNEVKQVDLKIKKGLPGMYGGELEFDYEQVVVMVDVNPSVNFADKKGKYLMRSGERNVKLNAVNVSGVDIEVSKIYQNNLLHFLNNYSYYYDYDNYGYNPYYYTGNYGKLIYEESVELDVNRNWIEEVNINLEEAMNGRYKGIYVLNVRSKDERWVNDSKMIALSDLGIIAKQSKQEIVVFVNSIAEAVPVPNVDISVISSNNQVLLNGKTDNLGVVHFKNIQEQMKGFTAQMVTAELGDDFNYIDLRETEIETSRFDVGGITQYSDFYTAFIYAERNLYRPGENIHLSAIVRDDKGLLIQPIPVLVKVITPTGKIFDEYNVTLNKQGSFDLSIPLPDYSQTGQYIAELYTGGNSLIGSYRVSVEEFVPDKIRVAVKPDKEQAKPGETVSIDIDAEFLFGAKAAGLKYETDIQLKSRSYISKNFPKFNFANTSVPAGQFQNTLLEGKLDGNGHTEINYIVPIGLSSGGIITGTAFVSVFDLTGRTVNRAAIFDVYPKDYFMGIRREGYYYGTNQDLQFQFVAVSKNDEALEGFDAYVELIRYEWQTVLRTDYNGRYYYASERKEVKEYDRNITLNEVTDFNIRVDKSGEYELRLYKVGVGDYVKTNFYAYSWGSSTASSFEVDKEGRVEIVLDKELYEPGDNAKILFTAPFSGKMLVTFERNGVYDYRYVDVNKRSVELNMTVKEEFLPNVYVTATLFKKHNADNTVPFLVGHGFMSMKVEKKSNKLAVEIDAPEKIKPRTKQQITIETEPEKDIYVTLAAVDEGILQINNFKTPDAYAYMNAKRPLKVESYDLYKLLLPEILSLKSPAGGEALARELQKRQNPIKSKRFKLVSYWSGIRKTNADGEVTVSLDIPQFNGEIRLMALAYTGSRYGSAEAFMKVADNIILEPEIPRFLSLGDSLRSNVTVINTTDDEGTVLVSVKTTGPLSIKSEMTKSVTVGPKATAQTYFDIVTTKDVGTGKITFETLGMAKVKEEIEIGVRPVSPLVTESGSGTVKAGEEQMINIPGNFLPKTKNTTLTISKFPAVKFAKQLKKLVGYPYGCIEQTVSKLFPQLYFEEIAKLVAPELYRTRTPVYFVKEGIRKIESMQMYDGSMAYWQGGTYSNWWGSVYAAHFLLEAKKAGYNVNESVLNKLLSYISKQAKEKSTYDYVSYQGNRRTVKKIANKEIPYSLYVLALAGRGDLSTMNYYKSRPHLLSTDSKYLIAGAYALMGKMTSFNEFLPKEFTPVKTERLTGGNFDSDARANSIMLNVMLEVDPTNPQVPFMVKYISGLTDHMYSTQERSFAFLALGKAAKLNADTDMKVEIVADGNVIATFDDRDISISDELKGKNEIKLKGSGTGEVYYFWFTEGVKLDEKVKEEDSFMMVRRDYFDYKTGWQIIGNSFEQGDLLVCKITLQGYERSAENIMISDLIPAGFEIENPRLNASTELQWKSKNPMNVQYMDIRDDRLILFTDLPRKNKVEFYYMLRVINRGAFELPAIAAEAMYDREFHSFNGATKIDVR